MDELEVEEVEKTSKKVYIAQIKLVEIIKGAANCQPRPDYLGHLTKKDDL